MPDPGSTPQPVSVEHTGAMATGPDIPISRIQVPLLLTIGLFATLAGGIVSMTMVWAHTSGHAENEHVHIDEGRAIQGGGIAFQSDVAHASQVLDARITTESKKTRRLIRAVTFNCKKSGDGFACTVASLPEDGD